MYIPIIIINNLNNMYNGLILIYPVKKIHNNNDNMVSRFSERSQLRLSISDCPALAHGHTGARIIILLLYTMYSMSQMFRMAASPQLSP